MRTLLSDLRYTQDMTEKSFIIGLTGNIASGKSAVRNYLENFGAMTIDADLTAKDSYLPGTPAWQAILDHFGDDLRGFDDQINRSRLGRIVFSDPAQLDALEQIVHPYVTEAILKQINETDRPFIVIEAIKLFESDIAQHCDQIWTVAADMEVRLNRMVENRGHSEEHARKKIDAQPPQEEKIARSNTTIWNNNRFSDTYQQTVEAIKGLGLPVSREIKQDLFSLRTIDESEMMRACEIIANHAVQDCPDERLYQLLSKKLVPILGYLEELLQIQRLSTRQDLALLTNQAPFKCEEFDNIETLQLLQEWLFGAYNLLVVPHDILSSKQAWQAGFLPGEDGSKFIPEQNYVSFLKANGLMPGEVWIKKLVQA